jgi:hypothetical protein
MILIGVPWTDVFVQKTSPPFASTCDWLRLRDGGDVKELVLFLFYFRGNHMCDIASHLLRNQYNHHYLDCTLLLLCSS